MGFIRWLADLAGPLFALFNAVDTGDEEAEKQALLDLQREAHDLQARRELMAEADTGKREIPT